MNAGVTAAAWSGGEKEREREREREENTLRHESVSMVVGNGDTTHTD